MPIPCRTRAPTLLVLLVGTLGCLPPTRSCRFSAHATAIIGSPAWSSACGNPRKGTAHSPPHSEGRAAPSPAQCGQRGPRASARTPARSRGRRSHRGAAQPHAKPCDAASNSPEPQRWAEPPGVAPSRCRVLASTSRSSAASLTPHTRIDPARASLAASLASASTIIRARDRKSVRGRQPSSWAATLASAWSTSTSAGR